MMCAGGDFYVYSYSKPDGTIFYVGKGIGDRDIQHLKKAKNINYTDPNKHKINTIRKLIRQGHEPIITRVVTGLDESTAFAIEEFLIAKIGRYDLGNGTLCNMTNGGEGLCGYVWSQEQRDAFSAKYSGKGNPNYGNTGEQSYWYGKTHSEETKNKISIAQLGRVFTEDHKAKMRKPKSEEGRLAIAKARQELRDSGYRPSPESNAKRSQTLKGRTISKDHANKIANALKGVPKPKVICPHCGKVGGSGLMHRWHFDNCKEINNVI